MTEYLLGATQYWTSGGPLLIPLALVCFAIWMYFLRTRHAMLAALREAEGLDAALREGKTLSALGVRSEAPPGGLQSALAKAISALAAGNKEPGPIFEREGERVMSRLERDIVVLGAVTAMAPLLGLLGTVIGMIETFDAVASTAGETGIRVASGVSKALITTQFGLVIAIPGMFGISRLSRLSGHVRVRWATLRAEVLLLLDTGRGTFEDCRV